ncbi:hypothetical protein EV586_101245 [Tumebacillus sp. BK434]|nr:hypothetical protein [Tumebacillus sp. BK434]TCP59046.1 hypothetical protein EV586_101245 [Tumebacillus sp. BK434]
MEENKQQHQPADDTLKQRAEGEYTLEELDRRIPSRPPEKSDGARA